MALPDVKTQQPNRRTVTGRVHLDHLRAVANLVTETLGRTLGQFINNSPQLAQRAHTAHSIQHTAHTGKYKVRQQQWRAEGPLL